MNKYVNRLRRHLGTMRTAKNSKGEISLLGTKSIRLRIVGALQR